MDQVVRRSESMRLVILTRTGPEHRYVVGRLAAAFGDALRAIIIANPAPRPLRKRASTYWKRYTLSQLFSRVTAKVYDRVAGISETRRRSSRAYLYPEGDPGVMPRADLLREVPGHNHAACLALLDELKPDVIAVFGTAVIKGDVVKRAARAVLNLHTGISPRYRGADSTFWAMHQGEPEWIGATVHMLTPALDAGPVLGTVRATPASGDDEGRLFAKCVERGALLYAEMISALVEGRVQPQPQDLSQGHEYRFVDRTVGAELRVQRAVRRGVPAGDGRAP
jgi:folate-dependent phosphoribosylglycinamide formyltransferase PurN